MVHVLSRKMFSSTAWPEPLLSTGSAQHSSSAFCSDWIAVSSYVFQFFCGPEGIALANPGGARARPALAARARVEFISEEPPQPAARLRPASEGGERLRSPSRHRRGRDRRAQIGVPTTTIAAGLELLEGGQLRAIGADTAASGTKKTGSVAASGKEANSVSSKKKTSWTMDAPATTKAKPLRTAAGSWCISCSPKFFNTALQSCISFLMGQRRRPIFILEYLGDRRLRRRSNDLVNRKKRTPWKGAPIRPPLPPSPHREPEPPSQAS